MRGSGAIRALGLVALGAIVATVIVVVAVHRRARAPVGSGTPVAMLEEYDALFAHPARTLQILRSLGVGIARVEVAWNLVAAAPTSRTRPSGNVYPAAVWAPYDALVEEARAHGIELDFLLTGGAPLWAAGPGAPRGDVSPGAWNPSASEYGHFVQAVATRYSGTYTPAGASSPLPGVHFWELWSEPNWGPSLAPQFAPNSSVIIAAREYRRLLDAGWGALQRTGHGHDTILIGGLSPRATPGAPPAALTGALGVSSPLSFTRTLYCVDSSYRPLRRSAALLAGCPATDAGSARFRHAHAALFEASGYGIHPYPFNLPPTAADTTNPDTIEFSQIPHLISALDRLHGLYGSHRRMSVDNTEFGYITNPPNTGTQYLSPDNAARYLNWTEYLTWRNPRIGTTMQFLLYDGDPGPSGTFGKGGFATGLIFYRGRPKATFYAYRMPIFLPVTRAAPGHALEVWGCARPAYYAYRDTLRAQYVGIQFRPGSSGPFRTIRTVRLNAVRSCYFDVDVNFPASGIVRLVWSYPPGDQRLRDPVTPGKTAIHSRKVQVTIR